MDPIEFLVFIPLLFYGSALSELLSEWKRFFEKEYFYLPYFLTTILITEIAIWNVFIYLDVINDFENITYFEYLKYLIQPILFLIMVHTLTPDHEEKDTKQYFLNKIRIVFILLTLYLACHFIPGLYKPGQMEYYRFIAIALSILVAFSKKPSALYLASILWFIGLFIR